MLPGSLQQMLFTKFLSLTIQSFRNTIGVKQEGIAWSQFAFFHGAIPFLEREKRDTKPTRSYVSALLCGEKRLTLPRIQIFLGGSMYSRKLSGFILGLFLSIVLVALTLITSGSGILVADGNPIPPLPPSPKPPAIQFHG